MSGLDWDDLRLFAVLAHAGSVRRAAKELEVHASTVTRRLEHFERQLDVKLFNRNPGGLGITPAGKEVLGRVEGIAAGIADMERAVAGSDRRLAGPLAVALPDALADAVMPEVAAFSRQWPAIRIEFVPAATQPNVGQREADCAVRITERPPEHLVGRCVGRVAVAAYGAKGMADAINAKERGWVELEAPPELRTNIRQRDFPNLPLRGSSRDLTMQVAALRGGLGIGPLPCAVGDAHPLLARAGAGAPMMVGEAWLLTHPDLRSSARVLEFMQMLARAFEQRAGLLQGQVGPRGEGLR